LVLASFCLVFALPGICQDNGSEVSEFRGNGAEISVTVRDATGEPLTSEAMVKLYRDGSIPSGSAETSRGRAALIVNFVGEFTVIVKAAGYEDAQKDVSARVSGRYAVDVFLRRISIDGTAAGGGLGGVPGRPVLAPKAKKAVDKGLEALGAEKMGDAEKYVGEAMRLAPGHPDVLYMQGVLSLKERNWTEAQTALEKATQIDPNHARAFAALGMALCDQGKYDEAIAPLEKSLALQSESGGAWETRWTLAKAYYQREHYEEALRTSQEALAESKGKAPEISLLVAQSLTAVGRYEEAARMLREFLKGRGDRKEAGTARRWLEKLTSSGKIQANQN
jgi:tetratricopeptide (TPR) repeat protein